MPASTGLADSGCLPDSVLPEGDERACQPEALDVADGASPARVSPRPSQEASEPGPSGGGCPPRADQETTAVLGGFCMLIHCHLIIGIL